MELRSDLVTGHVGDFPLLATFHMVFDNMEIKSAIAWGGALR